MSDQASPADDPLITELRGASEAHDAAKKRVELLRQSVLTRDVPREWTFSHEGVNTLARLQLGRYDFSTSMATRAEVEAKLREAVRALPFDRSACPLDVRSTATCKLTGESVMSWVHLEQDEPACERPEGHEWAPLTDEANPGEFPGGRKLIQGCPHCDGQRSTLWPLAKEPKHIVNFDVPAYPEGWVARELVTGDRPYVF